MNILAALELIEAVAAKGQAMQTISDAKLLYGLYVQTKATGKLDVAGFSKAGTLKLVIDAVTRTSATADALMDDKDSAANVAALLESLT